jgi:Kdo2-lipid IVA lauroyltransferase/acyltransferase
MEPPYAKEGHEIMTRFAQQLECTIRENPADYLWSHKRWKYNQERERKVMEEERKGKR